MFKWFNALYLVAAQLAGACIISIVLLIVAQVVGRQFGVIIPAIEEISGYLLVAACFLGLAHTFNSNSHVRVAILLHHLPPPWRISLEAFVLLMALMLTGVFCFGIWKLLLDSWQHQVVSSGYLAIPEWIPQSIMLFGAVLFMCAVANRAISSTTRAWLYLRRWLIDQGHWVE